MRTNTKTIMVKVEKTFQEIMEGTAFEDFLEVWNDWEKFRSDLYKRGCTNKLETFTKWIQGWGTYWDEDASDIVESWTGTRTDAKGIEFEPSKVWNVYSTKLLQYMEKRFDLLANGKKLESKAFNSLKLHSVDKYGWKNYRLDLGTFSFGPYSVPSYETKAKTFESLKKELTKEVYNYFNDLKRSIYI